ncbi:MAG: agmatinase [Oscillospiraceae bacterium]|nr:agmatinase [Oscillospiraceae bacterium]
MWNRISDAFMACDAEYRDARVVLFGAPFDGTASFRPGARFAPRAIRGDSHGLETWSPYWERDLASCAVFDGGDLELPFGNPQAALALIEGYVSSRLRDGKTPFMLGGEHLVTLGAVRACAKVYPGLRVLHLDAHADLRDEYLGEKLSHATVMRRVWELVGDGGLFQFGIRSGEAREFAFAGDHTVLHPFDLGGIADIAEALAGHPVYVSLDLDVLDPSVCPGTGTPEPGGVSFRDLQEALAAMHMLRVVGCDVTELSPPCDPSGISVAAACKIVREMLIAICEKQ